MALGVAREQAAGFGESGFVLEAGEDVEDFALGSGGVGNAVGGDEREMESAGEFDGGLVARFFVAIVMALEFDVYVAGSEDLDQAFDVAGVVFEIERERAFVASGEAEESFGEFLKVFTRCGRGVLLRAGAQFHAGHEAAEILIALAGFDQEGVAASVLSM